jgi:FtsP/CotA-like multicopper oxidase with cupredoxin domain
MSSKTRLGLMATTFALLLGAPLVAQVGEAARRQAVGPCPFTPIDVQKYGNHPFANPPEERAENGVLQTTLHVRYTDPGTTSIGGCGVTLRSYDGQLVGPTLRLRPSDVLDLELANELPVQTPDEAAGDVAQEAANAFIDTRPHPFNTTNLHTHGLHVSPVGNSDNVLLAIPPQTTFPYEIKVPPGHPPGTYWYHAHAHGSTAIQVGSGMAGALIIEDDPAKLPPSLRAASEHEKVMVIQTILYDTEGRADDITAFFPGPNPADCQAGKSNCTWPSSNRRVTVNGEIVPVIRMRPGEVQRWRLIDSAFRDSMFLRLEGHSLHEIALDGIYLGRVDSWAPDQTVELQPGYRSDVLVKAADRPGTYRLIDVAVDPPGPAPATSTAGGGSTTAAVRSLAAFNAPTLAGTRVALRGVAEKESVVALLVVEGEPMDMALPTSAEMAPLAPFPGVSLQAQAVGVQEAVFKLGSGMDPSGAQNYFQVNYHAFNPSRVRYVQLGATDTWNLTTIGDPPCVPRGGQGSIPALPHVFHIHVNPFQTTRLDPAGKPEVVWKDTLLVPPATNLQVFTRYLDYVGQFVMHCHILDHEDLGMMEIVEVVGEQPASALPAHGGH